VIRFQIKTSIFVFNVSTDIDEFSGDVLQFAQPEIAHEALYADKAVAKIRLSLRLAKNVSPPGKYVFHAYPLIRE
jgi:hypothetical protein